MARDNVLLVPFLDDSTSFACGVEIGMLYCAMKKPSNLVISDLFIAANQDQVFLMASRLGWRVAAWKEQEDGWFWCCLERE